MLHRRASPAAEDNLGHIPAPLQNIPDIQDLEESPADATAPGHGSHQVEIGLRGESPEEDDRDDEHLAAGHEGGRADREVEHGHVQSAVEGAVGGEADEDGGLRQGDAHDALEGDELGAGPGALEVGRHAPGEGDDARDADAGGEGLDDGDGEGGFAELVRERAHGGREDPFEEVDDQFYREDLEDTDPEDLAFVSFGTLRLGGGIDRLGTIGDCPCHVWASRACR